jgi:hypothetical protein
MAGEGGPQGADDRDEGARALNPASSEIYLSPSPRFSSI